MLEALNWYAIILLLGVLTLPVSFLAFKHLPDRGYSFSKPLGLLLVSLLAWWLANLKLLDFTGLTGWISVAVLEAFSLALLFFLPGLRASIKEWFSHRHNLKVVLASEAIFLAGYAVVLGLRSFILDTNSWTERFFNFAFLNSIATTTSLPPPDPWFEGQPINYYYGSHFLLGVMCKLSGLGADFGYTLGMGLVFALSAQACFGFVSNLVGLSRANRVPAIKYGLLGVVFMLVAGNLGVIRSFLKTGFTAWGDKFWPLNLDLHGLTSMIVDRKPSGDKVEILSEFPANSYLKGDLQANQMDIIFILLLLGFCLQFLVLSRRWTLVGKPFSLKALPALLLAGTLAGALNFINGVDFVPFLAFAVVLLGLGEWRGEGRWWGKLWRWLLQSAGVVAMTRLVYAFYSTNYASMVKAKPVENLENVPVIGKLSEFVALSLNNHTFLSEYLVQFGLFLLPVVSFYGLLVGRLWRESRNHSIKPLPRMIRVWVRIAGLEFACIGAFSLVMAFGDLREGDLTLRSVVLPLLGLLGAFATLWPGVWEELRRRPRLVFEGMAGFGLIAAGVLLRFELLGILVALLYLSARFGWRFVRERTEDWRSLGGLFTALAIGLAALLTLTSEIIYVRDINDTRFNMVLKFWQESWLLYSLAAAFATWQVLNWPRAGARKVEAEKRLTGSGRRRLVVPGLNFLRLGGLRRQFVEETDLNGNWAAYSLSEESLATGRIAPATRRAAVTTGARVGRRVWLAGLVVLLALSLSVPLLYARQVTDNFKTQYGLNSEAWYSQVFPAEYPAMRFLRDYAAQDPARRGIVLENNGMLYSYNGRVSAYTALPTLVGWPFHELQWRGYLDELDIWQPWVDMGKIYQTTDAKEAETLLRKYNVKYVFVGQIENGSKPVYSNIGEYTKNTPESLAKFGKFMKAIYADPLYNIYIYAFD